MTGHRIRAVALSLGLVVPLAAAASGADRAHPELLARLAPVRTIGVVAPEVDAYELTANDSRVKRPDWTELARANVAAGVEEALRARGFEARPFAPAAPAAQEELRQVSLLYDAVFAGIVQATYANRFPAKLERFEYSVGDLGALLAAEGVDALLFVHGVANISSGGRIAMQLLVGSGSGIDRLFLGVVDRAGAVLWFGAVASTTTDLRQPSSASQFARQALHPLPGTAR
jgi:hypothetical protein